MSRSHTRASAPPPKKVKPAVGRRCSAALTSVVARALPALACKIPDRQRKGQSAHTLFFFYFFLLFFFFSPATRPPGSSPDDTLSAPAAWATLSPPRKPPTPASQPGKTGP
ncbi:hypothetical protein EYF80_050692 [Liparis tanakae]|uniref:Uncharacterized protein n=1 Tax=Liparis tanakae TaxID=230148 RepID=A0A4Z2FD82_9TELE|nr:hypothetical protein EYF80_050692 [Liparis tanakae]